MSFRFPVFVSLLSLLAASSLGACGSDSSSPPPAGTGGALPSGCNNNNKAEGAEQCDGLDVKGVNCAMVLMNMSATGTVTCSNCTLVTTACHVPGGGGGATGTGGGTGTGGL